jgi:hypothetical protein
VSAGFSLRPLIPLLMKFASACWSETPSVVNGTTGSKISQGSEEISWGIVLPINHRVAKEESRFYTTMAIVVRRRGSVHS